MNDIFYKTRDGIYKSDSIFITTCITYLIMFAGTIGAFVGGLVFVVLIIPVAAGIGVRILFDYIYDGLKEVWLDIRKNK